jgi:glycosyltransferase involved in cell wall biosynthesis
MKKNIIFVWHEIPNYAAYQLNYIIKKSTNNIFIITNRLVNNQIKKILKNNIYSLQNLKEKKKIQKIILDKKPQIIFSSGWGYKYIQSLIKFIKHNNNAKIVSMIDNNYKGTIRQRMGKYYFFYFLRDLFDFYWVPGKSTSKLLNFYGINKTKIFQNLYNINQSIFNNRLKYNNRKNNIIFTGQCIERKNFTFIADFFSNYKYNKFIKKLIVITSTPKSKIKKKYLKSKRIKFYFNLGSREVSEILNRNKFFILPSKEDHWPLALLEAISCGCICIISKSIGSIVDLKKNNNLLILNKNDDTSLAKTLQFISKFSKKRINELHKLNKNINFEYNLKNFYKTFKLILKNCAK